LPYGGPPASVLGLCQGLQRAGVDVEVITTTANGVNTLPPSPSEGDVYDGVPVHYARRAFPRRFFGARVRGPLTRALARADVCHIHGVWNVPEWWASHLARAAGVPYVVSPRGMLQPEAMKRGRARKALAWALLDARNVKGAALLHATSEQEAAALRALDLNVPIAVVPNGVDLSGARGASPGFRTRLGIPKDAFLVLFLGRMHRIKRLDLIADAFAAARSTCPGMHLVLAGPDEHNLIPDLLIESLAAGVPAIVTRTCPWSEIETYGCGFWVEQTAPAIAAAIATLAGDPARRTAMGERASVFARDRYSWDAIAPQMARLYAELTKGV